MMMATDQAFGAAVWGGLIDYAVSLACLKPMMPPCHRFSFCARSLLFGPFCPKLRDVKVEQFRKFSRFVVDEFRVFTLLPLDSFVLKQQFRKPHHARQRRPHRVRHLSDQVASVTLDLEIIFHNGKSTVAAAAAAATQSRLSIEGKPERKKFFLRPV